MYFNPLKQYIHKTKSFIFIAPYIGVAMDENFNQKVVYGEPKKYFFNVQPVNTRSDFVFKTEKENFGELITSMKVATLPNKIKYLDKFNELDKVYLDGANPDGELENGDNANYYIYSIINQNTIIKLYFQKIIK